MLVPERSVRAAAVGLDAARGRRRWSRRSAFPKDPPVMVTCDVASLDRLASLGGAAVRAKTLIWIDHHVTNEGLGTIPIIDPIGIVDL